MSPHSLSRRDFLRLGAATLAAAVIARSFPFREARAEEKIEVPELPWPYTKLDPEMTRKLGHLGYYAFECAGGAFWGITVQLREKVGFPWTLLPIPDVETVKRAVLQKKHLHGLMQYGFGGAVGWGSLCGSLNGSLAVIQMVVGEKKAWVKLGRALMRIYETTPLPTRKSNEYAVRGEFLIPKSKMKSSKWLPSSVSHSVLCHVSVGTWCEVSGYASGSKERSERCARLTGDVAAFAVMLLNEYFDAYKESGDAEKAADEAVSRVEEILRREYGGTTRLSATTAACRTCHYKGKVYEDGQFTRGFMECEACHRDLTPHAHFFLRQPVVQHGQLESQQRLAQSFFTGGVVGAALGIVLGAGSAAVINNHRKRE